VTRTRRHPLKPRAYALVFSLAVAVTAASLAVVFSITG
jgi:hypothetical protein